MAWGRGVERLEMSPHLLGVGDGFFADKALSVRMGSLVWYNGIGSLQSLGSGIDILFGVKARDGYVFSSEVCWTALLSLS